MAIEEHARIKFTERVTATRAKPDGGRRKEYFQKGQEIVVPKASAQYRVEQGQAEFVRFENVEVPDKIEVKSEEMIALSSLVEQKDPLTVDAAELLKNALSAIELLDLEAARAAFKSLTAEVFDEFVETVDAEFDSDSRLVIGSTIEEFQETGDFATISMKDLTDAINSVLSKVGK